MWECFRQYWSSGTSPRRHSNRCARKKQSTSSVEKYLQLNKEALGVVEGGLELLEGAVHLLDLLRELDESGIILKHTALQILFGIQL